jgi:hypothetical protein
MKKELMQEKLESEYADYSVEDLEKALARQLMLERALTEQKETITKSYNDLIKAAKVKRTEILDVLEAKDSDTARAVLREVTKK